MTDHTLKDLNTLPSSPMKDGSSCKVLLTKQSIENGNGKLDKSDKPTSVPSGVMADAVGNNGVEPVVTLEVEYVESENLNDVQDLDLVRMNLLSALDSKDWVLVCEALNNVRRLSIFHKEVLQDMLVNVITLVVKSLKNPRSALCKTAIMASADIFNTYGDNMIDSLDPLLSQLLLKACQDKRFVCEVAQRALIGMTTSVSPLLLLPKLQPYLKHKNPRIRAKASMCYCRSVSQLGLEGINGYGIDKLIQVAASQLSDQLPESRESARTLLLELQSAYEKFHPQMSNTQPEQPVPKQPEPEQPKPEQPEPEQPEPEQLKTPWESFCQSKLSILSAQAVLRVTNVVAKEGIVLGS